MIAVIGAGAALFFAALYLTLRVSIRRAKVQIKEIIDDAPTNRKLRFDSPDKELERLLTEVNRLLAFRQRDLILHERKEREIRKQISNISHDLRTPLTSLLGYIELLQEEGISSEEREEYVKVAEKRARTLQSLVNGFYDLSRIEARDYPIVMEQTDLQLLLQRVLADYYGEIVSAGFQVELELPEASLPIKADDEVVMRIYMNLLQNTLKHGKRTLHVFQGMKDGRCMTIISNETESMRATDVPHLFERSYTSNVARNEQNTGLGLAVAKELMEGMGHSVRAEFNEPVFRIYLEWSS